MKKSKFIILGIFTFITLANLFLIFSLRDANSANNLTFSRKTLDFNREFSVTIDLDFLRNNLKPAYEQ